MTDPTEQPVLDKIRAMWEFAATTQFLYLFYDMFGLEEFDVEAFEQELIGAREAKLIPLTRLRLLQGLSGNRAIRHGFRGLLADISLENMDEFTRKQYLKRKPDANPFGDEENPTAWTELDVFAQIRVLRLLCTWQTINAERFRERAGVKDSEQLDWRVDPVGYDAEGNTYYLFDDNRLYYRDAPVIPEDKPIRRKFRGKKRKRGARRIESEEPESPTTTNGVEFDEDATWHVVCITMDDWTSYLAKLKKSKDIDEKAMYRHLHDNVLPTLIEEEKERERQREIKEQEYLREQAFLARKRSTRLVQKAEDRKHQEEKELELAKLQAADEERKREEQRIKKLEQEREARLQLREQRQRERELRIQQREEERKRAIEEAERTGSPIKFIAKHSESPAPVKKTPRQQALESQRGTSEPESRPKSEETWFFDCLCGKHGTNYDDGTLAVACEKCDIWQHVACLPDPKDREELTIRNGVPEGTYPDYEFICGRCKKKAKEANKAEAVKSKEQLRKEKEREANKAKYERRKIREKAKKEEERRKREEEQRMAMYNPNGQEFGTPSGEIRVRGGSSSPMQGTGSPNYSRTPGSAGQMYGLPGFSPNSTMTPSPYSQHGTPVHGQHPASQHVGIPSQYSSSQNQQGKSQSPPRQYHPSQQNVPQMPHLYQNNHPQQPPYNGPRLQQGTQQQQQQQQPYPQRSPQYYPYPPQPQQHLQAQQPPHVIQHHQQSAPQTSQAPQHPQPSPQPPQPQYQPGRPAIQPYWSPFTTSSSLPNGQQFPNPNRPQSNPQSQISSHQPQQRAIKPAPPSQPASSSQHKPLRIAAYPGPQRTPNIQPKAPSKSPEVGRKDVLGEYPPAPGGLVSPMASLGVKAEPGQASPKLSSPQQLSSGRGLKPMAQQVNLQKVDASGHESVLLGQYEIQGEPKVVSPVQKKEELKEVEARTENVQGVNGAQMEEVDGDDAVKENQRTKMSFLLN